MGKVTWRRLSVFAAVASFAALTGAGTGQAGVAVPGGPAVIGVPFGAAGQPHGQPGTQGAGPAVRTTSDTQLPRQLVVPDVLAVIQTGIPQSDVARIRKLNGVRSVLTVSGGAITIGGQTANVIGVDPGAFRSWTPPAAAGEQALWQALNRGQFVTGTAAQHTLGLTRGHSYPVSAATRSALTFGGSADLGIPGVDAVVNRAVASRLGLVPNLAVLINAPADNLASLVSQVHAVTGAQSHVVSLQPATASTPGRLPVDTSVPTGGPPRTCSCTRSRRPGTAPGCPGPSSRPSARSKAVTAPTWGRPPPGRSGRCSSCRPPGRRGASTASGTPAPRTS